MAMRRRQRRNDGDNRHARQTRVLGDGAQPKLTSAKVLVVGAGGLASSCFPLLVGAGVGSITIVDDDVVEVSNLHRQTMHTLDGALQRAFKVDSACEFARRLDPDVRVTPMRQRVTCDNALCLAKEHDVVVDCTDDVATRYVLNDACVLAGVPLVYGAALGTSGQVATFCSREAGCYRCAFPTMLAPHEAGSCAVDGVLGPIPALVGALQALETIKVLSGRAPSPFLTTLDVGGSLGPDSHMSVRLARRAGCFACSGADAALRDMRDTASWLDDARGVRLVRPCEISSAAKAVVVVDARPSSDSDVFEMLRDVPSAHVVVRLPVDVVRRDPQAAALALARARLEIGTNAGKVEAPAPLVVCACRRGRSSLVVASLLLAHGDSNDVVALSSFS